MRVYSQCTRRRSEIEEAAVTDILRSECQGTDFRVSNTGSALPCIGQTLELSQLQDSVDKTEEEGRSVARSQQEL